MPAKKTSKPTRKRKAGSPMSAGKSTAKKVAKRSAAAAKTVTRGAKALASNPRRAVRKAAANVQDTAARARNLGESVETVGTLIQETADFVDSMARRAKSRTGTPSTRKR
jgi:hypothetical protein